MSECKLQLIAEQKANAELKNKQIAAQQANTAQINQMIQASSSAVLCGPDCQKAKMAASLLAIYEAAEENVKTAPYQLDTARKNYYVYTEGQYEYNVQEVEKLHQDAVQYADKITAQFNNITNELNTLFKNYDISVVSLNNSATLYTGYKDKNVNMAHKLENIRDNTMTNNRKSYYEHTKYNSLKKWYTFLMVAYYIFLIIYIIVLFVKHKLTTDDPSFKTTIFIICAFAIYPWLIGGIISLIWTIIHTIMKFIPKNIYTSL